MTVVIFVTIMISILIYYHEYLTIATISQQNFVNYEFHCSTIIVPPYLLGGLVIGLPMALGEHLVHAKPSVYANW